MSGRGGRTVEKVISFRSAALPRGADGVWRIPRGREERARQRRMEWRARVSRGMRAVFADTVQVGKSTISIHRPPTISTSMRPRIA